MLLRRPTIASTLPRPVKGAIWVGEGGIGLSIGAGVSVMTGSVSAVSGVTSDEAGVIVATSVGTSVSVGSTRKVGITGSLWPTQALNSTINDTTTYFACVIRCRL